MTSPRPNSPRSNAEWELWGEIDPLFGVANWPGKQAGDTEAWTEQEFFALGASDWSDFLRRWERYGVVLGDCVEIGCGAGRMTRAMAASFRHVHGLDISTGMLQRAEEAVAGLPVTLHKTDGLTFPLPDASVDAAFSTHVFQHLDSGEDAERNWAEIARVLRPGGSLLIHLPVHFWPGGLERLESVYTARRSVGDVRAAIKRRRMGVTRQPIMRGQSYRWDALEELLTSLGLADVELGIFRLSSNGGQHTCVFARKP